MASANTSVTPSSPPTLHRACLWHSPPPLCHPHTPLWSFPGTSASSYLMKHAPGVMTAIRIARSAITKWCSHVTSHFTMTSLIDGSSASNCHHNPRTACFLPICHSVYFFEGKKLYNWGTQLYLGHWLDMGFSGMSMIELQKLDGFQTKNYGGKD